MRIPIRHALVNGQKLKAIGKRIRPEDTHSWCRLQIAVDGLLLGWRLKRENDGRKLNRGTTSLMLSTTVSGADPATPSANELAAGFYAVPCGWSGWSGVGGDLLMPLKADCSRDNNVCVDLTFP